ncbi:H+ symporter family protein [Orientia chuto str. Dubai]|uniref:H+ symporter family protein n=1 Tax=Orientia chuto str. Dubai TaxID=1359168 RepID=A0A0F3MHM5_9RICK|nr:peptide MFS transporter [Candidatus Orientia mediorientalis]KJV55151.1 H+ symporter family protein [Orientia chuto str. Dubai]
MKSSVNLSNTVTPTQVKKTPQFFLPLLFFVEMWERFSYYGMRSLLVLFLTSKLGFADIKAYTVYSLFAAIGYAGPVLGGFLADKLMGFRNMVLIGGTVIAAGHISMILVEFNSDLIYFGLSLIAVGTGMFKGNITNLLGACYDQDDSEERSKGFTLFYVSVNLGGALASISCGYIAHLYGWNYGFGLAGLGMIISLITFIKFQDTLGNKGLSSNPILINKRILGIKVFGIVLASCFLLALIASAMLIFSESFTSILILSGIIVLGVFANIVIKASAEQKPKLIVLSILIIFLMLFFALEMQLGSLMTLFTERNIQNNILGIVIPSSVSQAINPLSIIVLGFIFGKFFKFRKKNATAMFTFGLFTISICFFILYTGCLNANCGKVNYLYLIVAISVMGLGELCVAPLVQEQAVLLSPKNAKGVLMGIMMLSLAFSNLIGTEVSKYMSVPSINGEVNVFESLTIYKNGFLNVAISAAAISSSFLFFFKLVHKVISKQE